ncbi:MAG: hypothetical protein PVH40_09505 [Gemmatimonadales bacterium]|jgi:thymidylate kinase
MASIALIGPDGAGKTTIARRIELSCDVPTRYLYMGVNIESSNVALPTTKLGLRIKRLLQSNRGRRCDASATRASSKRTRLVRTLRAVARFSNLVADEWYRQVISWWHQMRGYIVLCDRYYPFDFNRHLQVDGQERRLFRFHRYLLERLYPRPTLVIFLDAPAAVLFARKREGTLESLEARRQSFLRLDQELPNFVRIDATRPVSEVVQEVSNHIRRIAGLGPTGSRLTEERS